MEADHRTFKLLNHQPPPGNCQPIFEQIFNLSHLELQAINSNIERTVNLQNLMDYLECIYTLKDIKSI